MSDYPVLSNVDRNVREPERHAITGVSRVTWWRLERQGAAPKSFPITGRSRGWRLSELLAFNEARIREGPAVVEYPESERNRARQKLVPKKRGWPKGRPRGQRKANPASLPDSAAAE